MAATIEFWPLLGAGLGGYFLGAVPFGLLLTKAMGLGDIRKMGSGNIGATNVLRTGNKAVAGLTLVLDGGKGALAVLLAAAFGQEAAMAAGAGAVIGHIFPLWLRFRGGKGVATAMGVLLAISWPTGLAVIGTWLAVAVIGRISSLAAICAMALAPAFAWGLEDPRLAALALGLGVLVIARHRTNIRQLLAGEEERITLDKGRGSSD
jgi:glycerol-3-phosphate acyltransferase PlsY